MVVFEMIRNRATRKRHRKSVSEYGSSIRFLEGYWFLFIIGLENDEMSVMCCPGKRIPDATREWK
jgi:hypothetical protein